MFFKHFDVLQLRPLNLKTAIRRSPVAGIMSQSWFLINPCTTAWTTPNSPSQKMMRRPIPRAPPLTTSHTTISDHDSDAKRNTRRPIIRRPFAIFCIIMVMLFSAFAWLNNASALTGNVEKTNPSDDLKVRSVFHILLPLLTNFSNWPKHSRSRIPFLQCM